jgi:2-oxoglutarate ferredoxin oxidoreductase subunit alpha
LPKLADLPEIQPYYVPSDMENYKVTTRNEDTKIRYWSIPGMKGFQHCNGGLEKDYATGNLSTDPENHEKMVLTRKQKVDNIVKKIPELEIEGISMPIVGNWLGGTYGHLKSAVDNLNNKGYKIALAHFTYLFPLPANTENVIDKYNKIVVCELNTGQFVSYLRSKIPVKYLANLTEFKVNLLKLLS